MGEIAIRIERLSKSYTINTAQVRHDTLRDLAMDGLRSFGKSRTKTVAENVMWALKDVSFDVRQGETLGLIGRNGAGKSTLLKILSRITDPTSGRAEIRGRVGSLLEVGTGFDRELSGRENVYLSGAILGLRKAEIDRKFDEIVAFSEIERFIDTPVKRYSSGMYVRLAFAVAAHLESEVLFVDEVLAVGDALFQKKCLGKMDDLSRQSRTLIFVSHNMAALTRLCRLGVWIDAGRVREIGPSAEVAMHYLDLGQNDAAEIDFAKTAETAPGSDYIRLTAARVCDDRGSVIASFPLQTAQTIEIEYRILRPTSSLRIGVSLVAADGTVIVNSKDTDGCPHPVERLPGSYLARCTIPAGLLMKGQYAVRLGSDTPNMQRHFLLERALVFRLHDVTSSEQQSERDGLVQLSLPWTVERTGSGSSARVATSVAPSWGGTLP